MHDFAGSQTKAWNRRRRLVRRWPIYVGALCLAFWLILPIAWAVLASLKTPAELYEFQWLPDNPSLVKYVETTQLPGFRYALANSVGLAVATTVVTITVSFLGGYAFSRYFFRWRHFLLIFVMVPRLVPSVALMLPLFDVFRSVGLLDTRVAVFLAHTGSAIPFATWIMAGFMNAIPRELEEAARVDGASLRHLLWHVIRPLAVPAIVTVGVWAFVLSWNEFPFVLSLIFSTEKRTLPFELFLMQDILSLTDWPLMNAFTILTIAPILILYAFMQKKVVAGLLQGATK